MREPRRVFAILFSSLVVAAGFGVVPAVADTTGSAEAEPPSAPGQLLVGYQLGTSSQARADARTQTGARLLDRVVAATTGRAEVELVALPAGANRNATIQRFESNPNVAYAEPNWVLTHDATSNDPYYTGGSLWGMYGDGTSPANANGSQAGEAWAAGNTGDDSVYVGVIDEGFQFTHPDLDGNAWTNPFDPPDGVDNDGNGYTDDVHGWDFYSGDNTVYDGTSDDHGTHVAGTIGAEGANGTGVAGVAWNVTLISGKFLGPRGGYTSGAVKAVDYMTNLKTRHGMNIVATSNSWGGGGFSQALFDAINRANALNILFIAAAGNSAVNTDSSPHYPSSYTNANVVSVASIMSSGAMSSFSNYGPASVDLGAPGSGIYSTLPNGYGSYSGTSMATPHVTGGAVLYATKFPGSTAAQIKSGLLGSVVSTASLAGKTVTGGRLNVGGLGTGSTGPTAPSVPTGLAGLAASSSQINVSWNAVTGATTYDLERSTTSSFTGTPTFGGLSATNTLDTGLSAGTQYSYRVRAVNSGGESGWSSPITVTTAAAASQTPTPSEITLSAVKRWNKGGYRVDLSWTGASTANVVLYRNAVAITTTLNDGAHTDSLGKKAGGTYIYKVCEQGTASCSSDVSVTF